MKRSLHQKSKDMDYKEFKKSYESSGLTQQAYGERISMSNSMVSYYLRKARAAESNLKEETNSMNRHGFSKLEIGTKLNQSINITLLSGVKIEIPI